MTRGQFSENFDFWYNNLISYQAPSLMEDEKSIVLTKAQDEVLLNHFTGNNPLSQGFDASAKRQADFSNMIRTIVREQAFHSDTSPYASTYEGKWDIDRPTDTYIIVNEEVEVSESCRPASPGVSPPWVYGNKHACTVVPLSASEYARLTQKPYKYPPKDQAWRLYTTLWVHRIEDGQPIVEEKAKTRIVGWWPEAVNLKYTIRYIKKPEPISLVIDAEHTADGECCELPEILHEEIIQRAVELAKAAWQGDINTTIEIGKRSE